MADIAAPRWGPPARLHAVQVKIGDRLIGRTRLDLRPRVKPGREYRTPWSVARDPDEFMGWEIRIPAGRALRDEVGQSRTTLEIWTRHAVEDGDPFVWFWFAEVEWRRTCCRLLGYMDAEVIAEAPTAMEIAGPISYGYMRTSAGPPE